MKATTIAALTLLSASPALAHTAAVPHAHPDASVWPVLIACAVIVLAAVVYIRDRRAAKAR